MGILVINCGSSTLKYKLFETKGERAISFGVIERIGEEESAVKYCIAGGRVNEKKRKVPSHDYAFGLVADILRDALCEIPDSHMSVDAVGHRVVHGGSKYSDSILIDSQVIADIKGYINLAPLHNPPNLAGIEAAMKVLPVPQVAVFDTAFHQSMPEHAYTYGLPYKLCEKHGIRRYGFHGSSHAFVSQYAADLMGLPLEEMKMITCHLGSGSSITAIQNGRSVDTSMGMTPLAGVMMGTRTGSFDPSITYFLEDKEGLSHKELDSLLNKKSGLLGVSGISNDLRDILSAAKGGNQRAQLAIAMHNYGIIKTIGAYAAAMNGVDAIVFTAGIGENSSDIREAICSHLSYLGVVVDKQLNRDADGACVVSEVGSCVNILVVPTDEELFIARETERCVADQCFSSAHEKPKTVVR